MMALTPLNMETFDKIATEMTYWKLFPLMVKDFWMRDEAKAILTPGMIPVTVAIPAGTGSAMPAMQEVPALVEAKKQQYKTLLITGSTGIKSVIGG